MLLIIVATLISQTCTVHDSVRGEPANIDLFTPAGERWGTLFGGSITATIRQPVRIDLSVLSSGLRFTSSTRSLTVFAQPTSTFGGHA